MPIVFYFDSHFIIHLRSQKNMFVDSKLFTGPLKQSRSSCGTGEASRMLNSHSESMNWREGTLSAESSGFVFHWGQSSPMQIQTNELNVQGLLTKHFEVKRPQMIFFFYYSYIKYISALTINFISIKTSWNTMFTILYSLQMITQAQHLNREYQILL